jgi:hypothetical protein
MHSVVLLLVDLPSKGLVREQVRTIVETWHPRLFEVDSFDDNGRTHSMLASTQDQLTRLHHHPAQLAA